MSLFDIAKDIVLASNGRLAEAIEKGLIGHLDFEFDPEEADE